MSLCSKSTSVLCINSTSKSYRKELESRAEAEEASSLALQALRAKNDQLVAELGRVESDALAASASAAAVGRRRRRRI